MKSLERSIVGLSLVMYCLIIPGCSSEKTPESYGLYALHGGQLVEIQKGGGPIDLEFSKDVKFILFDKRVGELVNSATLSTLVYIRNSIYLDGNGRFMKTETKNEWRKRGKSQIDLRAQPVKDKAEMVYLVPRQPLEPGVYQFAFEDSLQTRGFVARAFYVDKSSVAIQGLSDGKCHDEEFIALFVGFVQRGEGLVSCADGDRIVANAQTIKSGPGKSDVSLTDAIVAGDFKATKGILDKGVTKQDMERALLLAANHGHAEIVNLLLEKGIHVNVRNQFGQTTLIVAANGNQTDMARLLIKKGVDLNAQDETGNTALMRSLGAENRKLIDLLVDSGADLNLQAKNGRTVLAEINSQIKRKDEVSRPDDSPGVKDRLDRSKRFLVGIAAMLESKGAKQ